MKPIVDMSEEELRFAADLFDGLARYCSARANWVGAVKRGHKTFAGQARLYAERVLLNLTPEADVFIIGRPKAPEDEGRHEAADTA